MEDQLNDIVVGIISAAETTRLKNIEREAEMQRWREAELQREELELRKEIERQMRAELEIQSNLWIRSRRLKRFLRQCEVSLSGRLGGDGDAAQWLDWARAHANSMDPLQNGGVEQTIRNHIESSCTKSQY